MLGMNCTVDFFFVSILGILSSITFLHHQLQIVPHSFRISLCSTYYTMFLDTIVESSIVCRYKRYSIYHWPHYHSSLCWHVFSHLGRVLASVNVFTITYSVSICFSTQAYITNSPLAGLGMFPCSYTQLKITRLLGYGSTCPFILVKQPVTRDQARCFTLSSAPRHTVKIVRLLD